MALTSFAQEGEQFPELEGTTLTDKTISLPADTKGKYTLVGMAWSKKAEEDLNSWMEPIYKTFMYKPEKPSLFSSDYDVNLYFIPMFTGVKAAAEGPVRAKAKKDMDKRLHQYVLFYKGSLKPLKEALDLDDKNKPYFFVLDDSGKVVYATSGAYSDDKLQEIEELLEEE